MKKIEFKNIASTLLIFVSAIILAGIWTYLYFEVSNERELISEYTKERSLSDSEDKNFQEMKAFFTSNKNEIDTINSIFVTSDEESINLFNKIENLGKKLGVSASIELVNEEQLSTYNQEILSLKIETEGFFNETFDFLRQLEELPYRLEINNTTLQTTRGIKGNHIWSGEFVVYVVSYIKE